MTPAEFETLISGLQGKVIAEFERLVLPPLYDLLGKFKYRIFNRGLSADLEKIGNYSTETPFFATQDSFVVKSAFKPKDRKRAVTTGKNPGKKGSRRTSVDLADGYKELREMQGFQTATVDLSYSGSLSQNIQVFRQKGRVGIQFLKLEEAEIGAHQERHFGKVIFRLSEFELETFQSAVIQNIADFFLKNL